MLMSVKTILHVITPSYASLLQSVQNIYEKRPLRWLVHRYHNPSVLHLSRLVALCLSPAHLQTDAGKSAAYSSTLLNDFLWGAQLWGKTQVAIQVIFWTHTHTHNIFIEHHAPYMSIYYSLCAAQCSFSVQILLLFHWTCAYVLTDIMAEPDPYGPDFF